MPSVSVLFINDKVVGPHLELIRNICDPTSLTKPHVTVRYSNNVAFPEPHFDIEVSHINLVEASSFGLDESELRKRFTVYIRAESRDLMRHEYKPDFPQSKFHITVYNGSSLVFAKALLKILRNFNWNLRLELPKSTKLQEIPVTSKRKSLNDSSRNFDNSLMKLFKKITKKELTWKLVKELNDSERLNLVDRICNHLMERTKTFRSKGIVETAFSNSIESNEIEVPNHSVIHITPPELARDIASYTLSLLPTEIDIHFGDPAIGTGAFFSALLDVIGERKLSSALGIDVNKNHAQIAQTRWTEKGLITKVADFLHIDRLEPRTLILANPPYLRQQAIDKTSKQKLRERASVKAGMVVNGLSGLYVYFLLLSDAWLSEGGVAAWLIPSEFMQTEYGVAIRKYLTERVQLIRIHQYGTTPRFERVLVNPSVVIFAKRQSNPNQKVIMSFGGTLTNPEFEENQTTEELRQRAKWSIPVRNREKDYGTILRIGDLFDVRRGIATGANDFFILERAELQKLGLSDSFFRPILPKASQLESDIINRKVDGYPETKTDLCVLDVDLDENEIRKSYPKLFQYLTSDKAKNALKSTLVKSRKRWYKQENRDPAPFLCTYMGRKRINGTPLRFLWNKSDAIAANTYLMMFPKPKLIEVLSTNPERYADLFDILKQSAEETMNEQWRLHAGGLHKIEPRELLDVRLTSEPEWLTRSLDMEIR